MLEFPHLLSSLNLHNDEQALLPVFPCRRRLCPVWFWQNDALLVCSIFSSMSSSPTDRVRSLNRDCCKPSCSWSGKADVTSPVRTCNRQGTLLTNPNAVSGCDGGDSFTCTNMSPWAVDNNTAYGFAAVNISGGNEGSWCCQCYELSFTSGPVAGKKMVRSKAHPHIANLC